MSKVRVNRLKPLSDSIEDDFDQNNTKQFRRAPLRMTHNRPQESDTFRQSHLKKFLIKDNISQMTIDLPYQSLMGVDYVHKLNSPHNSQVLIRSKRTKSKRTITLPQFLQENETQQYKRRLNLKLDFFKDSRDNNSIYNQLYENVSQNNSIRLNKLAQIQEIPLHQFIDYNKLDQIKSYKMLTTSNQKILVLPKLLIKLDENSTVNQTTLNNTNNNVLNFYLKKNRSFNQLTTLVRAQELLRSLQKKSRLRKSQYKNDQVSSDSYLQSLKRFNKIRDFNPQEKF